MTRRLKFTNDTLAMEALNKAGQYTIEHGKPIPLHYHRGRKGQSIYPFADMEIGDSFAVPVNPSKDLDWTRWTSRISNAAANYRKGYAPTKRFSTRQIKAEGVMRCWRVK